MSNKLNAPNLQTATLPDLLKAGVAKFNLPFETTTYLLSALTLTSGLLTNVTGRYRNERLYPNLFLMIVAPPASGKGAMSFARKCVEKIHQELFVKSCEPIQTGGPEPRGSKKGEGVNTPRSVVLIPGNITGSRLAEHLNWNETSGCPSVMCESEIDTVYSAIRGEHGQYSDMLRKIFHNEPIQFSRRKDNEFVHVKEPKMSIALSGTLNQLKSLVGSSENGLYSRFMVFHLESQTAYTSAKPCEICEDHTEFFIRLAEEYWTFWKFASEHPLEVKLTDEQWATLDGYFAQEHAWTMSTGNPNFSSVVKRHAVILHKICMTLTAMRRFEVRSESVELELMCENEDFENAWAIVAQSLAHSNRLFSLLPGAPISHSDLKRQQLYGQMPDTFLTKELQVKARGLGLTENIAEKYLRDFVKAGMLNKLSHGVYQKISDGGMEE